MCDVILCNVIAFIIFAISFIFWYFIYGLECYMNGGSLGRNQYLMPFQCAFEELKWAIPFWGWKERQRYCQERNCPELANSLPGPLHFLIMHIIIPFGGTIAWLSIT